MYMINFLLLMLLSVSMFCAQALPLKKVTTTNDTVAVTSKGIKSTTNLGTTFFNIGLEYQYSPVSPTGNPTVFPTPVLMKLLSNRPSKPEDAEKFIANLVAHFSFVNKNEEATAATTESQQKAVNN